MDNTDYSSLLESKKELKEKIYLLTIQLQQTQQQLDRYYECTCRVCGDTINHHDDIPDDWGYVEHSSILLCDKCHDRWNKRFGDIKLMREI